MYTTLAPVPTRATTSFTLSWGLLSIPVSAYTAVEETRVKRAEFIEVGEAIVSVGRSPIRKDTGAVIDQADVIRKAQTTGGEWVTLTDDEIADCTADEAGVATIVTFVPRRNVPDYLPTGLYQVRPANLKGKPIPAAIKATSLLFAAMRKRKVVALIKVSLRGPARYGLLDHEGNLTLVATHDQIRGARPILDVPHTDAEMDMALNLIDAVGTDHPVLRDETAPAVQTFVDAKGSGKAPVAAKPAVPLNDDIMAVLSASVAARKGKVA
jgi:non-homologous end joining protein Ku